jgi:hypothetical protein
MRSTVRLALSALLFVAACSDAKTGDGNAGDILGPGDAAIDGVTQDGAESDTDVNVTPDTETDAETDTDTATDTATDTDAEVAVADPDPEVLDTTDGGDGDAGPGDAGDTAVDDTGDAGAEVSPDVLTDVPTDVPTDIEVDAGPQPEFDQVFTVSDGADAELYAMAVLESGAVVILWRSGDDDVLLTPINPWTSSIAPPVVVEAGAGNASITKGGDVVAMGEHVAVIWWSEAPGEDPDDDNVQAIRFKTGALDDLTGPGTILTTDGKDDLWRPHLIYQAPASLCAVWQGDKDVKITCSVDQGTTFGPIYEVEPPGVSATLSSGAFLNTGELIVAYQAKIGSQPSIYVRKSADMGMTWSAALDVGMNSGVGQALQPTMAPGTAGQIHLAWYNSYQGTTSAWHTTSNDGAVWAAPAELPTIKSWVALKPGRATAVHVSGQDAMPGYGTTHYMTSEDDGLSWGVAEPIPVTPGADTAIEFNAELEANLIEGWLHLAWWEGGVQNQSLRFVTVEP